MHSKIFLHRYRVSAHEIGVVGEPGDRPLVYEGGEIDSGKKVRLEVFPAAALGFAAREKLAAEATAAKQLRHANIPALSDFGVEDDNLVYVTEDVDGTTAEQWVTTCGPMPVSPVLRIASQVMSALGAAGFHGIVHRAVNPSNLVLVPGQTAQGEWPLVKVLHFVGVAPAFSGTDLSSPDLDRSLPYVSPEQLQHGTVDFRSEMYSLGGTMWFLLTGAPPPLLPVNGSMAAPSAATALAAKKMSAMPREIQHLVAQMLAANPDARPRDSLTIHKRLQDCLTQVERPELALHKLASSIPEPDATSLKDQLVPLKVLAIVALFLAVATIAAVALRGYSWPRQAVRPKEPKGFPKRVDRIAPFPAPVSAKRTDPIVWIATPPSPALAESKSTPSLPPKNSANVRPPGTGVVEYAPAENLAVVPSPKIWEPPATLQTRKTAPATASNVSPPPPATDSWKLAATTQVELVPPPAKPREGKTSKASQATPKKTAGPEVRRAEPVEPEAKRTQPPRSTERSTAVAPDTTAPLVQLTNSAAEPAETTPPKLQQPDPEPR